ncbi:MAG: hypothetical protein LBI39_04285, partial [Puniceicoccales bacterium]|nr:hypothetical protein [Puniceicoccales bacterium]
MDSLSQRPNFALTATALLMRSSNFRLTSKNVTEFRSGRAIQIGGKSYTFALSTLHIISLAFLTIATAGFVWAILAIKLCVDRKNAKSQIAILYAALSRPTATDDQVHPVEPQLQGAFTVDLAPAHCDEPEAAETLQEEEGAQPSGQEAQQIAAAQSPPPIANAPQQQPGMPAPQSAAGSATSTIAPPSPQQLPQQSGSAVPPPPPVQPPLSPTATASGAPAASEEAADDPPAATAMDKP